MHGLTDLFIAKNIDMYVVPEHWQKFRIVQWEPKANNHASSVVTHRDRKAGPEVLLALQCRALFYYCDMTLL